MARVEDTRAAVWESLAGAERIQGIVSYILVFTRKLEDTCGVPGDRGSRALDAARAVFPDVVGRRSSTRRGRCPR